jgi:predicted MFS family arabinose efflux permease
LEEAGDELGRGGRRAFAITSLTVAMALGLLPMVSIGILAPFLIDDLDISRGEVGLLVAVVAGVSAVLSPFVGALFDRTGDRRALLMVLATGAVSLVLMAAAPTFAVMSLALALAGVCRAGANPATNRLITVRLPRGRRGWITGVKQSGETAAIVVSAAALPALAALSGWRLPLLVLGLAAAATVLGAALSIERVDAPVPPGPVRGTGRMPSSIQWLNTYNFVMGAGTGAITAYLPLYANEVGGLNETTAGAVMIAAGLCGGISRLLWSHWSESRWGFPGSLAGLAAIAVVSCTVLLAAPELGTAAYWAGAAIWGIGGLGFGAVSMLAAMAEAPDSSTGRASGLVVFWFSFGLALAPPAFGWLVEQQDAYGPGFSMLIGLYVAAVAIMLAARGSFRPIESGTRLESH